MKPFTPDDLYLHHQVSELHCVPGHPLAACTVRHVDRENDKYLSRIWAYAADGQPPRQLTQGPGLDKEPRWSPDGKRLAFASDRAGGAPQLYVMDLAGGEARQLGQFDLGVTQLCWAPDGKHLYATVAVAVDPDRRAGGGGGSAQRDPNAPEVAWRLPYKSDGVGYILGREVHLVRIDAQSGEAAQLTQGPLDVMGMDPSPDGRHLAYTRTREGRFAHCTDLWVCDANGRGHRRLTHEHAQVLQPVWSPRGAKIAFGGAIKEGDGEVRLWLLDLESGQVTRLGPADLEVADAQSLQWKADGSAVTLVRAYQGRHDIVEIPVGTGGGEPRVLVNGNRQFSVCAGNGEQFFFGVDSPVQPSELFTARRDGSDERQLSDLNPWWKERTPLKLESRRFEVPDGRGGTEQVQAWLLRPSDAKGAAPLLADVHGGPASYALLSFDTNVYWQVLCSRGWTILMANTVGSSSFGGEFCARLSGHWGEYDMPQYEAILSQLQADGVADERLAIAGKSYGGYFSAWAIGHSQSFRAAVVMAPVGNLETHYGTSDGGYYADPLYLGMPEQRFDRQRARQLSPLQYVEEATTPTLFLQGKEDERCPKCQAEELFVSMLRAGDTPTELVLYPGEGHTFLGEGRPSLRADANRRIAEWVTRHT